MNVTSFYYIAYPDGYPPDPLVAASEVYIEVANENGDINNFDFTYSIMVCTVEYINRYLVDKLYYTHPALILVKNFDDFTIKKVIESILPNIDKIAIKK
jgi:hypothetical protein